MMLFLSERKTPVCYLMVRDLLYDLNYLALSAHTQIHV